MRSKQPLVIAIGAAITITTLMHSSAAAAECNLETFPSLPDVAINSVEHMSVPVSHCKLEGTIDREINFELLLPDTWNGKFAMGGSGGFAGGYANTAQDFFAATQRGWATVATDTGHQAHSMDASWALDNLERVVNFGHLAVHRTAVTSKPLIESFYSQGIKRSVFVGCSRGGGQALMTAQRYPDDFDGIVGMSPAIDWTHEMGARWIRIAQAMYPDPNDISKPVIGPSEVALLGNAVLEQCDALDGVEDGILNDPRICDFDVTALSCTTTSVGSCLSEDQIAAAEVIYQDTLIDGQVVPGMAFGAELHPMGWDLWFTGGFEPGEALEYHEGSDTGAFPAPLTPNGSWGFSTQIMKYLIHNDPDWSYQGYDFADFGERARRVASTLNALNPDLSAFRANGGKMIIDNGWADGSMSAKRTIAYYDSVLAFDPTVRDDVRLFIRPGVTHCVGGSGPDGTDYLAAIDKWLETGKAPEKLEANFRRPFSEIEGGRIVCAHPGVVTHSGSGDPNDPENYSCAVP